MIRIPFLIALLTVFAGSHATELDERIAQSVAAIEE